jgi:hypothetical protein
MKASILFFIPLLILMTACEKEGQAAVGTQEPKAPGEVIIDNPDDGRLEEGELKPIVIVTELLAQLGFAVKEQISQEKFHELLIENTELKLGQSVRILKYTNVFTASAVCKIRDRKDITITRIEDGELKVLEESQVQVIGHKEDCEHLEQRLISQRKSLPLDEFSIQKVLKRPTLLSQTAFATTEFLGEEVLAIGSDLGKAALVFNPKNSMLGELFYKEKFEVDGVEYSNSESIRTLSRGR